MSLSAQREALARIHGRYARAGRPFKTRIYEQAPCTPYQRMLDSAEIPEATKTKLRAEHAGLDPFALKKSIEEKLKKFFTALGNLDRESTKT